MTHHQICFTRLSGQGSGDGWQAVNMSPELPQSAVSSFTRFQNGNITPPAFDEEDAASQIVTELQTDGEYAFYTLIKCNAAADDRGRAIMFAHSYVFSLDEFVKDPQAVLCVDKSNFSFDVSSTQEMRPSLVRTDAKNLRECVESLGLTKESYTTLVQCVYSILDGKTKNSLHLICDCSEETIRKYMTCIYAALPYEFRKKISFSTYEFQNGGVKTIIFDRKVKNPGSYYIDPKTEENNVLTEVVKKRLSKYEFMRVIPGNYDSDSDLDSYFKDLEERLAMFGSAQTTSLELYKIAYDLIRDEDSGPENMDTQALCQRLNEYMSAPTAHPYIDKQIQFVLAEIVERNIELNDVLSEKLCKKLETTRDADLIECGYRYNSAKVKRMSVDDGAKYLFEAYTNRNSESFIQIKKLLDEDEKGREILVKLYTMVAESIVKNSGGVPSAEDIRGFYDETKNLSSADEMAKLVFGLSVKYGLKLAVAEKEPKKLADTMNDLLIYVLNDKKEMARGVAKATKNAYWDNFKFADLVIDIPGYYDNVKPEGHELYDLAAGFIAILEIFKTDNTPYFSDALTELNAGASKTLDAAEYTAAMNKLIDACVENRDMVWEGNLDIWLHLTFTLRKIVGNPAKFLLEKGIIPSIEAFDDMYRGSEYLKDETSLDDFVEQLRECAQDKNEISKIAADAIRTIKDDKKQMEQLRKKEEREERRRAKETAKETARETSEKGSFFSGLFKKRNKNNNDDNDNNDDIGG